MCFNILQAKFGLRCSVNVENYHTLFICGFMLVFFFYVSFRESKALLNGIDKKGTVDKMTIGSRFHVMSYQFSRSFFYYFYLMFLNIFESLFFSFKLYIFVSLSSRLSILDNFFLSKLNLLVSFLSSFHCECIRFGLIFFSFR